MINYPALEALGALVCSSIVITESGSYSKLIQRAREELRDREDNLRQDQYDYWLAAGGLNFTIQPSKYLEASED